MSKAIGPILVSSDGHGPFPMAAQETSPQTQELVDEEVRRIVDDAYAEVTTLLTENRPKLDALAQALLQHETLDEQDAYEKAGVDQPREPEPTPAL
jgi:cell division protease FtsH